MKKMEDDDDKQTKDRPKTKSERVVYIMDHISNGLSDEELDNLIRLIDEIHSKRKG
jgi:hypothetical protein